MVLYKYINGLLCLQSLLFAMKGLFFFFMKMVKFLFFEVTTLFSLIFQQIEISILTEPAPTRAP